MYTYIYIWQSLITFVVDPVIQSQTVSLNLIELVP